MPQTPVFIEALARTVRAMTSFVKTGVIFLYRRLIAPYNETDDRLRKELVLNVFLVGTILLISVLTSLITYNAITLGEAYKGASPFLLLGIDLMFIMLLALSRYGKHDVSATVFLLLYFTAATYALTTWGTDVPQGLLSYAVIIFMSSVLMSTRVLFLFTGLAAITLVTLTHLQTVGALVPQTYWRTDTVGIQDAFMTVFTISLISLVAWLSNRLIARSLERARTSEAALKEERDLLEQRVEERTRDLRQAQMEQLTELRRGAEMGRLASGLIHDLINPLTAVSLNLEALKDQPHEELTTARSHLDQAVDVTRHMEGFLTALRQQIQYREILTFYSINEVVSQVAKVLDYKARKANIRFFFIHDDQDVRTYGNPFKFNQVVTNLLSNAIDAYDGLVCLPERRVVDVSIRHEQHTITLRVTDRGCGIPPQHLERVFEPFFTTKTLDRGTGIGLSTSRAIVENDLKGTIRAESREGDGSTFIVEFPFETTHITA